MVFTKAQPGVAASVPKIARRIFSFGEFSSGSTALTLTGASSAKVGSEIAEIKTKTNANSLFFCNTGSASFIFFK